MRCVGTSAKWPLFPHQQKRQLWGWLYSVFNRVDPDRVKEVGPDRACAEWILKSGGRIQWKGFTHMEKDYNFLPKGDISKYKLESIDATDTAVMSIGFLHLEGLTELKKMILDNCKYLNDDALVYLHFVKDSLNHLQLSSADVTDGGIQQLIILKNLKYLQLFNLPEVRNKKATLEMLKQSLPECEIEYLDVEPKKGDT